MSLNEMCAFNIGNIIVENQKTINYNSKMVSNRKVKMAVEKQKNSVLVIIVLS